MSGLVPKALVALLLWMSSNKTILETKAALVLLYSKLIHKFGNKMKKISLVNTKRDAELHQAAEIKAKPAEIEADEPAEIKAEPIKPKAKGRPKGSLNKGPSKPRAKKTQIQETPVDETPVYEENLKMPADPSSSDIAAAMLKLLQDQTYSRQARKQRLYQSWFQ